MKAKKVTADAAAVITAKVVRAVKAGAIAPTVAVRAVVAVQAAITAKVADRAAVLLMPVGVEGMPDVTVWDVRPVLAVIPAKKARKI